jgi:long-subunit acyl-CoA synthetase (AMP-forming)
MGYLVDKDKPDPDVVKKNAEEFSVCALGHRWFHTGDIGQITVDGQLQIIDRKKDLVKLQMGEYVALSKVENVLKECPLVELPLCYADSREKFCVALVCPSHVALKALGRSLGLGEDVPALCAHKQIIAEVSRTRTRTRILTLTLTLTLSLTPTLSLSLTLSLSRTPNPNPEQVSKQCLAVCKPKLVGFEIPKVLGLVAETWTPDNDLLTAAMKLKRIPIVAKHKAELDALYALGNSK